MMRSKSVNLLSRFAGNTAPVLLGVHWTLFALGIYLRGNSSRLFEHFIYEPLLLKILTVLDIPAIFVGDLLLGVRSTEIGSFPVLVYIALITAQWIAIGFALDWTLFRSVRQRNKREP